MDLMWSHHGFGDWVIVGLLSLSRALIIHAIAAPIFFLLLLWVYFKKFSFTTPLQTAIIFVAFVIFMDVFIVAAVIERNFKMFESLLGTWVPFLLIFLSTWITGSIITHRVFWSLPFLTFPSSSNPYGLYPCGVSARKPQLWMVRIIDLRNYKHAV